MEISVAEPFSSGLRRAVPFTQVDILSSSRYYSFLVRSVKAKSSLWTSIFFKDPFQRLVRVILFMVRVPVLSEQMLLAPPIV
jgi:hypothetical protein